MEDKGLDQRRPSKGRAIWDFFWHSAVGAIVGVVALIILRKYF